jgi:hypothetical protein
MATGRPRGGSKGPAPAENPIAIGPALAPNGNGPAKAYRHKGEKRRNIPPAAIAAEGRVPAAPKLNYSYSPRLDPILRFDATGAPDKLPDLLEKAKREPLTEAEARVLAEALRQQEPWLEWAGKREANGFVVDPVALHIHERVSTQAILKIATRKDVTRDLFADPQLDYHKAVQFYRHEMDWSNRLILGDSLQVMASLAQREDLAGKVTNDLRRSASWDQVCKQRIRRSADAIRQERRPHQRDDELPWRALSPSWKRRCFPHARPCGSRQAPRTSKGAPIQAVSTVGFLPRLVTISFVRPLSASMVNGP